MSSEQPAIQVENVSKSYLLYARPADRLRQFVFPKVQRVLRKPPARYYEEFWALRNVSLSVHRGETVGLIGRNGAGKSTLLQVICGTLTPSAGSVDVRGKVAALLELGAGFMPEFTGIENVYTYASVLGLTHQQIDERLDAILSFADIGDFVYQPLKTYSSGMAVRLAFAVATAVDPDILIVDEALSVGDIAFQTKCLRHIQRFIENGGTTIFVSHSAPQITTLCSRAYWLHDGQVRGEGEAKSVIRAYTNFMRDGFDEDVRASVVQDDATHPIERRRGPSWTTITPAHQVDMREKARFTEFRIIDTDAEEALALVDRLPCRIRIDMKIVCSGNVGQPLIGVGCFNALNQPIVHFNTAALGVTLSSWEAGTTHVASVVFDFPLIANGEYLLAIGLDDGLPGESTMLCHVHALRSLAVAVRNRTMYGQYGMVPVTAESVSIQVDGENQEA